MNPQVDPILAIALIVNLIKPLLAGRLPAAMADSAVRVLAIALGIGGEVGYATLTSSVTARIGTSMPQPALRPDQAPHEYA